VPAAGVAAAAPLRGGVHAAASRLRVRAAASESTGGGGVYEAPMELLSEGVRRHTVRALRTLLPRHAPPPRTACAPHAAAVHAQKAHSAFAFGVSAAHTHARRTLTRACLPRLAAAQISVFVADETGMINRVAGVFARRGYNIESLAVGLNIDRALFTIVVIGTDVAIDKLIKQIYKLPNVIKARTCRRRRRRYARVHAACSARLQCAIALLVQRRKPSLLACSHAHTAPTPRARAAQVEDLTYTSCVERGLLLVKVEAQPPARSAILELATIFRAAVVDVGERSMMLAVTGDPGKTRAFQRAMSKFGVLAVARTGKLALRREQAYNEGRRQQLIAAARARADAAAEAAHAGGGSGGDAGAGGAAPAGSARAVAAAATAAAAASAASASGGDVYKLEAGDLTGVWDYAVLNPHFSDDGDGAGASPRAARARGAYKPHTLSLLVENAPGVLDRVTGVIARRGYNVQSLGVGPAEAPEISRITLVVPGTEADCAKLLHQLRKLTPVLDAVDITAVPFVERELMLVKVAADASQRSELLDLAAVFRAKVSDISGDTLTVEVTGDCEKLAQLQALLTPYGIVEVARTGRVALVRDSGVNTALLEEIASDPFFA
jgi:acetolactate synthase-1/3 small subunit